MIPSVMVALRPAITRQLQSKIYACARGLAAGVFLFVFVACADTPETESAEEGESPEAAVMTRAMVRDGA